MHFILTSGALAKFDNLRKNYESEKNVDLNEKPSLISTPVFFGGTDIVNRSKQIAFLEKIYTVCRINLIHEEEIQSLLQSQAYITASRLMVAACLYVQTQISSSKRKSVLYRIIEDNLGVTPENILNDKDKQACYLAAGRFLKTPGAFEHLNARLEQNKTPPFTEQEWEQFCSFLKEMSPKKETKENYSTFPVTSTTQAFFGTTFAYAGATVGVVLADGVSHSTSAIAPRVQLTALIGSTLLVFNPTGTTGVALLAPVIATKLLTSFCTISLAHVMSKAASYVGQGVGIGVGLPFDLAYNLLWSVCSVINRYYNTAPTITPINGLRLFDGQTIIAGIPVQLIPEDQLLPGYTKKMLEITETGELIVDGSPIKDTESPMKLPSEVLAELNKHLAMRAQSQERSDMPKNEEPKSTEHDEVDSLSII